MSGFDGLLANDAEVLDGLSIQERALIPDGLPDELSIRNIAELSYPDNKAKQDALVKLLVKECKIGSLPYYGNIEGWSYREDRPNPYPKIAGKMPLVWFIDGINTLYGSAEDCLIHRDNFKVYLQSKNQWPVTGLLLNWWPDSEPKESKLKSVKYEDGIQFDVNEGLLKVIDSNDKKIEQFNNQIYQKLDERNKEETNKFFASMQVEREETERRKRYEEAMIELAERSRETKLSASESAVDRCETIDPPKPMGRVKPDTRNEMERSGLLNIPKGSGVWADPIDETVKILYEELRKPPEIPQVWSRMWSNPPHGYGITPAIDEKGKPITDSQGKQMLSMPGFDPLSLRNFKRLALWKNYPNPI